ncbi:MAG: YbjN domain-containing protein [Verrucomicrobiota bacterium]
MRPPSLQILSVEEAFGQNGWHCEAVEGQDVLRAVFTGHHTRIELIAQAYTPMNALAVIGEMPLPLDEDHQPALLELLARANKSLNLGGFEYDLDRQRLVFRITNIFDREKYDADIVTSMVHCSVAELDRVAPYATTVVRTPADLLPDLDLQLLLMREDFIPPVPGDDENLP